MQKRHGSRRDAAGKAVAHHEMLPGPVAIRPNVTLDVHSLIVGCMAMLVGAQCLSFGIVARRYAASRGLLPAQPYLAKPQGVVTLERVLIVATILLIIGLFGIGYAVAQWAAVGFGPLQYGAMVRILTISCTLVALALQIVFAALLDALFAIDTE